MKRLCTLLLISFAALSCEMVDEKLDEILGKKDIVVFAEGTELTANVLSKQTVLNYKFESTLDWEVKTEADWLEIDPMRGKAGKDIKIQIKVLHNKDKEGRTGYADLTLSNNDIYRITINQAGDDDENEDIVVGIPNNQIWYTSTDGEIVESYSGEYNEYADALKTFGVNIVSNTYVDGKGVIEFDGDVTTIGNYAFYLCHSLTSVTIPDSVTEIGESAFYMCENLSSITIPNSVTTIGKRAFYNCDSLTSVTIPDSVTTIGDAAFFHCDGLTSVTIPDSVTTIGDYAFEYCDSLTSVTIGDSVTTIGDYAFQGCSSLTSVTIPDSVTTIGEGAFENCSSLESVTIGNSVTTIGDYAFAHCSSLTSVTIGDSVTTIGGLAFDGCTSLTSVTIPDSVTTIRSSAFWGCSSLTSVTIGDSVTTIGEGVFALCSSLQEFKGKFASEDGRCLIVDGVLNSFAIGCGATEYTIPDSVTTIGYYAFNNCSSLTSVTIPDSVTTIGSSAFAGCSSLTSVTIPDSVTTIGEWAFSHCYSLTSVTIPDSVTTIGEWVFAYCYDLTSVTIGDSVTTIGGYAFNGCYRLTSVYCKAITPPAGDSSMFSDNAPDRKIYVPMESVEAYKSASGWSEYADAIVGYDFDRNEEVVQPEQPEEIPNNQIWYTSVDGEIVEPYSGEYNEYAEAITTFGVNIVSNTYADGKGVIEFDGDVTTIGGNAFSGCSSLTSVTIPDSVTTIGDYAFSNCSSLASVTIPDSVTMIGDFAFHNCSSLASVTIPDSVTEIGHGAFRGCSNLQEFNGKFASEDGRCLIVDGTLISFAPAGLTEYTIPNSVTKIGKAAFWYCSRLTSVTIGDSVTTIGDMAFDGCSNLTSVTIPDSVTTIGGDAFSGCSSLTSVTIGDSVTTIGENAFYKCRSLTSVTIPNSVTTIGDRAFGNCSSLQEFNGKFASEDGRCLIIDGVLNSFATAGLTEYTIPDSVTTIGDYALRGCSSLTSVTIPDSVTSIGDYAFSHCFSLTSVTIPDGVTSIGDYAFSHCFSLTSVYCKATTPPAGGFDMFDDNASGRKIYVPMESVEAYKSAQGWSDYADDIIGYDF